MDKKVEYLQMIQEPICRMSTSSAIIKGFAATIVASISLVSFDTTKGIVLILSFVPVLVFAVLDTYYLRLERKYRFLYNQVREGYHEVDYSMELTSDRKEIKSAKARIWDCIFSPSIMIFYPVMFIILATVSAFKFAGLV